MNLHRRRKLSVLLAILGLGAFFSLLGITQAQNRVYVPIDRETLILTKAIPDSSVLDSAQFTKIREPAA